MKIGTKDALKTILTIAGSVFLAGIIFLSPMTAGVAYADDLDTYSGQIDPFTGEPVMNTSGINEVSTLSNRKMITEKMYYDFSVGKYAYPVDNGLTDVYSNAADGMILTEPVQISIPDGVTILVYCDGNLQNTTLEYRAKGGYTVRALYNDNETELFSFMIVGSKTGAVSAYQMPPYFRVDSVTLDGQEVSHTRNLVDMTDEGYYTVDYRCERTDVRYNLNVTVDHTPPQVVFHGIDEDGKARGPVSWEGLEMGDTLRVYKDGGEFLHEGDKLTQSGRYEVIVTDDAGNTITEAFTILIYLDRNGFAFVGIIALVIGGLVGYLIWHRKHMKVR